MQLNVEQFSTHDTNMSRGYRYLTKVISVHSIVYPKVISKSVLKIRKQLVTALNITFLLTDLTLLARVLEDS